ncbi:hypothetical protein CBR_g669 [Chara braunii]|uniref:Integrase catalytic domain-containing protein n=1 Tax=Chara braunii TaxID=69332 RepID=A0A388KBV1_CHABU|nr:hypothetical protein CBR_g669 [Chara braunii]|eukprot:GBG67538.1 hypothetical protein CBR_g669 [Chara braunii]
MAMSSTVRIGNAASMGCSLAEQVADRGDATCRCDRAATWPSSANRKRRRVLALLERPLLKIPVLDRLRGGRSCKGNRRAIAECCAGYLCSPSFSSSSSMSSSSWITGLTTTDRQKRGDTRLQGLKIAEAESPKRKFVVAANLEGRQVDVSTSRQDLTGKTVVVVGLGVSGKAAVKLALARGANVVAVDRRTDIAALEETLFKSEDAGRLRTELGSHPRDAFLDASMVVLSPGVPLSEPTIAEAIGLAQIALIKAEEQRQLAAEAARLQAEEAATAEKLRLQAEADADAQDRRKEAQDPLQRHEANNIERLKFWHFERNGDDATPEEQHKEFLSKLVTRLLCACNYQRSEIERQNQELQQQYQDLKTQHQELANLRRMVQSHEDATRALNSRVLDLEQVVPGPDCGASSSAPSSRQLEERVDHVVAMLGDINTFAAATTINSQLDTLKIEVQQLQSTNSDGNPKLYKMPTFQLEKFDNYKHQDPILWWEAFTTQLRILPVAKHVYIDALFLNSKGGCQTWLTHLAATHGVDVADPRDNITWEELTRLMKKRFIVDDAPALAINRLFTMSCAALSQALGDREQYTTFAMIIDKAREIIKTNRGAAHEKSRWQPTYVEAASRDEDQVAAVQLQSNNKSQNNGKAKPASQAGNGQPTPWVKFSLTEAEYKYRGRYGCYYWCNNTKHKTSLCQDQAKEDVRPHSAALLATSCTSRDDANVVSPRYTYEDYAVHLVPPLDQPLHVQQSTACTVSSPSATNLAASPQSIARDSTSWSRLEEIDPLTFTDFQWMLVPSTGRLPKPHCNMLMAQLRDYLHTAVPTALMDVGVEVVDLHAYIAKIDREFKTQRYDDIDAPLLYVRIQIGEATCSALIDCGASSNYISPDFMVPAGLGPRVRRKPQPTQVTWADGHTHKSIDRCIDDVPVYFAPHASEAVSFDILDTKFDMILGMSWLRSEDHSMNFYNRTVHICDRNGILVPCTVPLPHPSISCHVVSATSMRVSIIRDDIEEMGVCFLHALPPHDASSTDSPSDPRITELLDAYRDVFEDPHGVVPDRPIRHEIILEDGAVPPRGCVYRMSEEELSVLRAQLDDLLGKGWIRPSSSPYGAPVLFVRKKNKDLRLCIDYRKLNAQTIRNAGPLPRIDDLLERLGGAQFFSKLDLKSGYRQLEIRKEDRYKTAFKTRGYDNGVPTHGGSACTHLPRRAKIKANRDKCEFAQQELKYLGHYVTPQGIRPLVDKIEALRVWPEPTNTTDVRSFMGLAGYYQRFITGYSMIAAPMTRLQSPKVPFVFDDDARRSFQALKTTMLMAPVLSIYDPTLPTRVTTDASGYGIGAVLEQHDGDDWHPVEYFSHKVPPVNSLDDARKELLAFVMALKRWRHFLLRRLRFTWVTDNNPLTYYKTQDTVSSTIGRWMYFIDQFDFTPKHVHGLSNRAGDALSRRPDLCAMTHHAFAFDEELQRHFIQAYHDRDTRFMSAFWTALMQECGMKMKPSSARHPQTDGQTERAHQTAQMMLRTLIRPDQKDWVDRLPDIEFAYNTSVHPTIGVTPFELHHGGRKGHIFADLLLPRPADIDAACSPASVRKYRELLTQARTNMQKAQVRTQQQANRRRVPCPIRADDLVWVSAEEFALEQDVSRKLLPKWFRPWSVTSAAGDDPDGPSFVINIPEHLTVHPVFHASQDPPSVDGHEEVDRVISNRKYGSKPRQYKVTFRACDPDDTRWISGADLKSSAPLIYAHYERQRLAKGPPRPAPPTRTVVPPSDRQLRPRR